MAARSRTFAWSDPALITAHLGRRSGLEMLRAMGSGELPVPPVMHLLDVGGLEVEEGRAVVVMIPQEFHYNSLGTVHGGILATLLDTATGCAVQSTLPAGVGYTSLDLMTRFLRPVMVASGALRCEGTVLSRAGPRRLPRPESPTPRAAWSRTAPRPAWCSRPTLTDLSIALDNLV